MPLLRSSVSTGCLPTVCRRTEDPVLYAVAQPSATPGGLTSHGPIGIVIPTVGPLKRQLLGSILTLTAKRTDDAPFPIGNVRASRAARRRRARRGGSRRPDDVGRAHLAGADLVRSRRDARDHHAVHGHVRVARRAR